jgi:hypothetical protein
MAQVTLSLPAGYHRADDPTHLDVDMLDEVEFNADECLFYEALTDAGYHEAGNAKWTHYGTNLSGTHFHGKTSGAALWIASRDGKVIYVAEVVQ